MRLVLRDGTNNKTNEVRPTMRNIAHGEIKTNENWRFLSGKIKIAAILKLVLSWEKSREQCLSRQSKTYKEMARKIFFER